MEERGYAREAVLAAGQKNKEKVYWLRKLSGELEFASFPYDYKKNMQESKRNQVKAETKFTFTGQHYQQLMKISGESDNRLYMVLMAALLVLLEKYTGKRDILLGAPILKQEIEGKFINTLLVLRNHIEETFTFKELVLATRNTLLEAVENRNYPLEILARQINISSFEYDDALLFDVAVMLENIQDKKYLQSVNPGMIFSFWRGDGIIDTTIAYNPLLYREETLQRIENHFMRLVETLIYHVDTPVIDVRFLSREEKRLLVHELNNTARGFPRHKTIPELFEEQVERFPHHIAVCQAWDPHPIRANIFITYMELNRKSNQLANYLYIEKHLQPEDAVGVLMERSSLLLAALLGILKAGGVYVPLDPDDPGPRLKNIIDDSAVRIVISRKNRIKTLNRLQWECSSFHTFLCLDSTDVYGEKEIEKCGLMDEKLWEYIGESATDDITGGGWLTGTTGQPFTREEMDEYGDNILKKLKPLLYKTMRVLEIGCASGITMYRIAPLVALYYGTDLSRVIIEKNKEKALEQGHNNIRLASLPAHEIHQLDEKSFDLVIINSVIQSFHGHNYLRSVIGQVIDLMSPEGRLFIGDVMDRDLKSELIGFMKEFKRVNRDKNYITKTDWSEELFLSRAFFEDLTFQFPAICNVECSGKIYTIENELTRFRYDALLRVDKEAGEKKQGMIRPGHKYQEDASALKKCNCQEPASCVRPRQLAYVIYTSGSSGRPKGVMIEHSSVARLVKNSGFIQWKTGHRLLATGAATFDISTFEIWGPLLNGVPVVLEDKPAILNGMELEQSLCRHKVSHLHLIPQLFDQLAAGHDAVFAGLEYFLVGGDRVRTQYVNKTRKKYPHLQILHMYGPTENTTFSTFFPVKGEYEDALPIGRPIANSVVYVLDKYLRLQPVGVYGELCVGGNGIARGYLNNPGLTAEKFLILPSISKKIYKTGDLARWNSEGQLEFAGRIDRQVKIRGYRIETGEIESQVLSYDDIKEAVVTVRTGENTGQNAELYLCAYVVPHEKNKRIDPSDLRFYLAGKLPGYMIPSAFVSLQKLPLTASGKIDKRSLPHPGKELPGNEYTAPGNPVEETLVGIWGDILGIEGSSIGIDSNFFQLGGHSLKAAMLVNRIHQELEVQVPISEIFRSQTIRELSHYIGNAAKGKFSAVEAVEKREYYPLSPAQKRLYIMQQMELDDTLYNMPDFIPISVEFDKERFASALKRLTARHESLRTSFHIIAETPVQQIHDELEFEIGYYDSGYSQQDFIRFFDLSRAPLLRVALMEIRREKYLLMMDIHHIITDGISFSIMLEELMALYAGQELPPLRLQYKDYSHWQVRQLERDKEVIKRQEEYWMKQFENGIPQLDFPTDFQGQPGQDFSGQPVNFEIDRETTGQIKKIVLETGTTLYILLLSVYTILLSKYTLKQDIVVGTGIADRIHADLENIIGMFVNMLPIRNTLPEEKTFSRFVGEVKKNALKAFENQDYPFEELVKKLKPHREYGRNPLFDVEFTFQNTPQKEIEIPGLTFTPDRQMHAFARFDLVLHAYEQNDTIGMRLIFARYLFKPSTIEEIRKNFLQILQQVVDNREIKLKDIKISHHLTAARSSNKKNEMHFDF